METAKLNRKQREALEFLRANLSTLPRSETGAILTGLNTTLLSSLRRKGLISGDLYLGGRVHNLEVK